MSAKAHYVIFETQEVFDSPKSMAKELGITESTLDNYLYPPKPWFGLYLYSVPDTDSKCIKCKIDLDNSNWHKFNQKENYRICKKCSCKYRGKHASQTKKRDWISYKYRTLRGRYGGDVTKEELKNLFESQNKKCVLCRDELELDAHLDHIVPLSKGGKTVISNLQFLCKMCNRGKWDCTGEQYIAHCKKVTKNNLETEK